MNNIRLYIENEEIELDERVQIAITKQFDDLTNPTTIINDWSKTVAIPFSEKNNKIFGHIYEPDRLIVADENRSVGIYFDPYKKLDFRLEWNSNVLMTGYAKMNNISQINGRGVYNITLNGQLGKVFQEMKKITFDTSTTDTDYLIDGSLYVDEFINKELVYNCWNHSSQHIYNVDDATVADIIGFAPNNSFNEDFDYKTFQSAPNVSSQFKNVLADNKFKEATGVDPETAIPNGMLPREIGEYRSYHQIPYIFFNKLFQIFQKKAEAITGYKFNLNPTWFNVNNPYWYDLVFMLKQLEAKKNLSYTNSYSRRGTVIGNHPAHGESTSWKMEYDLSDRPHFLWNIINEQLKVYNPDTNLFVTYQSGPQTNTGTLQLSNKLTFTVGNILSQDSEEIRVDPNAAFITEYYVNDGVTRTKIASIMYRGEECVLETTGYNSVVTIANRVVTPRSVFSVQSPTIEFAIPNSLAQREFWIEQSMSYINNSGSTFGGIWQHKADSSWGSGFLLGGSFTSETISGDLSLIISPITNRSGSHFTLNDLWNNDYNLFTTIINYCKMYRILISVDDIKKQINFYPTTEFFKDYTIEDWTDKIDKSKDFILDPISWKKKYILFNYDDSTTEQGEVYKKKYGFNYGEYRLTTNYNFDEDTNNLFDKLKTSIVNTDMVLSWNNLYSSEGSVSRISYSLPSEIYIYCKDKDNKYKDCFGQYYFFRGIRAFDTQKSLNLRTVNISDDTPFQQSTNSYFYSQSMDQIRSNYYPYLDNRITINDKYVYSLFGIPKASYTYEPDIIEDKESIYSLIWKDYIDERYNLQNKKLTCYVKLTPLDFANFDFNKFVKIGNQLYIVNKIYDYDPTSSDTTKIDLITIQDTSKYFSSQLMWYLDDLVVEGRPIFISGSVDDTELTYGYIKSISEPTFDNGLTTKEIGGVQFSIVPIRSRAAGNIAYNYEITYKKIDRYNQDNDTVYNLTIKNRYDSESISFTRYRDYPNPPVFESINPTTIELGDSDLTIRVRTQDKPINLSFDNLQVGFTTEVLDDWDYYNDDYYGYTITLRVHNNSISTVEPVYTATVNVTTGSGFVISQGISVKARIRRPSAGEIIS